VHPGNSRTLTREEIEGVFRTTRRYWSAGQPIVALNLPAGSADRMHFDRAVLRLEPDDVARYWIDRKIRGGEPPPRTVANPMLLVRVVAQLPAGIGYVPVHLLAPSVRVVARVHGGNLIIGGKAPS
jgi:DNA-binding transcriptional LysR family regulator